MARLTSSAVERQHLGKIHNQMPVFGVVEIDLNNGNRVEGLITGSRTGNDAGSNGTPYPRNGYAEVSIVTISKTSHVIDLLDVKSARDVTASRLDAYVDAGIASYADE